MDDINTRPEVTRFKCTAERYHKTAEVGILPSERAKKMLDVVVGDSAPLVMDGCRMAFVPVVNLGPRSLAGKSLAGFRTTQSRRITVLYDMIMYEMRFTNPL